MEKLKALVLEAWNASYHLLEQGLEYGSPENILADALVWVPRPGGIMVNAEKGEATIGNYGRATWRK